MTSESYSLLIYRQIGGIFLVVMFVANQYTIWFDSELEAIHVFGSWEMKWLTKSCVKLPI